MIKGLKKLGEILFSRKLTLMALVLFAVSMGYATFLENDFGTPVARGAVYDAWWFELLMFILGVNFVGNIYRYNLFSRQKLAILTFHLAFIVILLGAFITRYTSYEGLVRIREGQSTNKIISQKRYFKIQLEDKQEHWHFEKGLAMTRFKQPAIEEQLGHDKTPLKISVTKFVPDAMQGIVDGMEEDEVIELVSSSEGGGRQSYLLKKGGSIYLNGHEITFQNEQDEAINILKTHEGYSINSSEELSFMVMATQEAGTLYKDSTDRLNLRALYRSDHINFVVSATHPGKTIDYITTEWLRMPPIFCL